MAADIVTVVPRGGYKLCVVVVEHKENKVEVKKHTTEVIKSVTTQLINVKTQQKNVWRFNEQFSLNS